MPVLVTRPAAQAAAWVAWLRREGVDARALPLIDIVPAADRAPARDAWAGLDRAAMVFFVSPNAVQHFFAVRPPTAAWPADTLAAAPGPGTAEALAAAGVPAAQVVAPPADAPTMDSEALWARLQSRPWAGRRVLVVRGEGGRDWLADRLLEAGAEVQALAVYARRPPMPDEAMQALLRAAAEAPQAHLWLLSSSEAVRHLAALPGGVPRGACAIATHPRIAQTAREAGFAAVRLCAPGRDAVLRALRDAPIQSGPP